jgi:hypothetical protein
MFTRTTTHLLIFLALLATSLSANQQLSTRFILTSATDLSTTIQLAEAHNFKFIDTVNASNDTQLFIFESAHNSIKVTYKLISTEKSKHQPHFE